MIHPHTCVQYIDDRVGSGVLATAFIPVGTIVYVQDGLDIVITPDSPLLQIPQLRTEIDRYAIIEPPGGQRVISWDYAKYMNHCCHSNTLSSGYGFEIALPASGTFRRTPCVDRIATDSRSSFEKSGRPF